MKKAMLIVVVLLAALAAATTAAASDTRISVGLKVWNNTWKETVRPKAGSAESFDNGMALMAGPSLSVQSPKDWFAGITYLAALGDYESPDWFASGDKMKFERTDLDLVAGFLLLDPVNDLKFGFFAVYKEIEAPASYTNQAAGLNDIDAGTWKLKGPGIGLRMEKHLDESAVLYGNAAYLFLEQEFAFASGGVSRFDTDGWALEVGVTNAFTKAISADLGIKYQRFKGERGNGDTLTDSFSGLTAGITYSF